MMSRRRSAVAVLLVVLLAALVPPFINVNRYRGRIAGTIGASLGRQVTVGSVSLRLLPQPGFVLRDMVVGDDPAFGAEPMLRSEEVSAALRLTSLWRGKLEIATLSLKYPSLNLVRSEDGRWNLEGLLYRGVQVSPAPTAAARQQGRTRFPYIEAQNGRINFKYGTEKKVFAFTEADFALWLASEKEWRFRLDATPIRTDVTVADTGLLRASGSFQKSSTLRQTQVDIRARLEKAQLGQFTRLLYGRDRGWRGSFDVDATAVGTAENLKITLAGSLDDLGRYDISSGQPFRIDATCSANFSAGESVQSHFVFESPDSLRDLDCRSPVGSGELTVRGGITSYFGKNGYELTVAARELPMSAITALAKRAKKDMAGDLSAEGMVNAKFDLRTAGPPEDLRTLWTGGGEARGVRFSSDTLAKPLSVSDAGFEIRQAEARAGTAGSGGSAKRGRSGAISAPAGTTVVSQLLMGPVTLGSGVADEPSALRLQASLDGRGYEAHVSGNGEIERLLTIARAFGMRSLGAGAVPAGNAAVDLTISGPWQGFAPYTLDGTAHVQNATAHLKGVAAPLRIATADLTFSGEAVAARNLAVSLEGARLRAEGWVTHAANCAGVTECEVQGELQFGAVDIGELNGLLNPKAQNTSAWSLLRGRSAESPGWITRLRGNVKVSTPTLTARAFTASRVSAQMILGEGSARFENVQGDVFGGHHTGTWRGYFSGGAPVYEGAGTLQGISLASASSMLSPQRDATFATGTANVAYELVLPGWSAAEFVAGATGVFSLEAKNGALRRLVLPSPAAGMVQFRTATARFQLRAPMLTLDSCKVSGPNGIYVISGNATFDRKLDLSLVQDAAHSYAVSGTLDLPEVAQAPAAAAAVTAAKQPAAMSPSAVRKPGKTLRR